jgi:predicted nucleic acid-binding protein
VLLVDTSVWVNHLRRADPQLSRALEEGEVLTHPFVIGELACGSLRRREEFLSLLSRMPAATVATHDEVMQLVERHRLYGRGIGWIDAQVLASALLSDAELYTHDQALREAWRRLA